MEIDISGRFYHPDHGYVTLSTVQVLTICGLEEYPSRKVIKADKCNFCEHRIEAGLEPACSNTCPTDARVFGDLSDEESLVAKLVKKENLTGLLESEGTKPQVYYRGGKKEIFDAKKAINSNRT